MKEEGKDVTVVSALDYEEEEKRTGDVLDIIFKQRYKDLGITFLSCQNWKSTRQSSTSIIDDMFGRINSVVGRNPDLSISSNIMYWVDKSN